MNPRPRAYESPALPLSYLATTGGKILLRQWRFVNKIMSDPHHPSNSLTCARLLILSLLVLILGLLGAWYLLRPPANHNALAIGEAASVEKVDIPLQPPLELDFKSRAELLQLRSQAVYSHPELLKSEYRPYGPIFGRIVDGLPWWGVKGQFYYGNGQHSIEGPSEESRFILNPYLLVAAEFYTRLDADRYRESEVSDTGFIFYCAPYSLLWFPRQAYAEAEYRADCIDRIGGGFFDLIAYNARDLNLTYLYVSYPDSQGIAHSDPPDRAYANPQYIHQGSSCGYAGGCNNMSPYTPEIDGIRIQSLPAKVTIWLWKEDPSDPHRAPDMTFVLYFQ